MHCYMFRERPLFNNGGGSEHFGGLGGKGNWILFWGQGGGA